MRRAAVLLTVCFGVSCGQTDDRRVARTEDQNTKLGGDVAARVGTEAIPLSVIASVAAAQNISAREAARKVIDDEIAASSARAQGHDRRTPASWRLVSARARLTSERLADEARRAGPPTDDEVRALSAKHWTEVDRPPSVRVIHALVMRPKDPSLLDSARAFAHEIKAAATPMADNELETKLKSMPHDPKLELLVQPLPAFAEDGRVTEGAGQMDAVFSKAAFAVPTSGATSDVVETGFGFHVIRLVERIPEKRMPIESRRLAFTEEVHALRARELVKQRLLALRKTTEVSVAPSAEQLMRTINVSRDTVSTP